VILSGDIGRQPGRFRGDEFKLQQVLANLISNAIRHSPAGSQVSVEAQTLEQHVRLVVNDQGPGIDPADLPYFFEPFWKSDRARVRDHTAYRDGSGSGLGLSIVRQLVELHGGQVAASLPQEGGLRVTITLPAIIVDRTEEGEVG
jgi:signal transduction histidine kinase